MRHLPLLSFQFAVLVLAVLAALAGPLRAPVFDTDARATSTTGDWHSGDVHTPYLRKTYYLSLARDWLELASTSEDETVRLDAANRAYEHARASMEMAPANGYAWAAMAWAELIRDNKPEAFAALEQARFWAPYSAPLALDRAVIAQTWWPELDTTERAHVLDDVWIASRGYGHRFREAVAENPRLQVLLMLARNREALNNPPG